MSKIIFPTEKIGAVKRKSKKAAVKREAVFLDGKFICPNCFEYNYEVIKCELDADKARPMRYTGKCRTCETRIQYNKETPLLKS